MLAELAAEEPSVTVRGFGINHPDSAAWNDLAIGETNLPWLQDPPLRSVWTSWDAEWRDVVILDGQNRKLAAFEVYFKPLDVPENYAALKDMLRSFATR
jgi:hypothetical protein